MVDEEKKFERDGLMFRMRVIRDEYMREPWKDDDSHGIVSDWTNRPKRPGERILIRDRNSFRYYDIEATTEKAERDGWGVDPALANGLTRKQVIALAVDRDFARLKAWCDDEWWWVTVRVDLLDLGGSPINRHEYFATLSGIESDSGDDYLMEVAGELADEIAEKVKGQDAVCLKIRK